MFIHASSPQHLESCTLRNESAFFLMNSEAINGTPWQIQTPLTCYPLPNHSFFCFPVGLNPCLGASGEHRFSTLAAQNSQFECIKNIMADVFTCPPDVLI